jgi:hypothetical protein
MILYGMRIKVRSQSLSMRGNLKRCPICRELGAEVTMTHRFRSALAFLLMAGGVLAASPAGAESQLDLALVIAVDVSSSMEPEEQGIQREGFIDAFRSSLVHEVIRNGMLGRIAVTYVEWSGAKDQQVLVPWTVIDGAEGAKAFANQLASKPTRQSGMTSISGVIDFSRRLLDDMGSAPVRRVIDISGDGPNNDGRKVVEARDEALAEGITINGLPIMFKREGSTPEMEGLDLYYRECVIGGVGSFMIPLHDPEQFAMVIRTKIMREIAGLGDRSSLVVPAQASMDCVTGEKRKDEDGTGRMKKP